MERDWYVEQRKSSGNGHSYCSHLTLVSFLLLLLLLGKTKKKILYLLLLLTMVLVLICLQQMRFVFFFFFHFLGLSLTVLWLVAQDWMFACPDSCRCRGLENWGWWPGSTFTTGTYGENITSFLSNPRITLHKPQITYTFLVAECLGGCMSCLWDFPRVSWSFLLLPNTPTSQSPCQPLPSDQHKCFWCLLRYFPYTKSAQGPAT